MYDKAISLFEDKNNKQNFANITSSAIKFRNNTVHYNTISHTE